MDRKKQSEEWQRYAWQTAMAVTQRLADEIAAEIKAQGLSLTELEDRSGVPRQRIRDVIRRRHGFVVFNLLRLACGLRIDGSKILGRAEERRRKQD